MSPGYAVSGSNHTDSTHATEEPAAPVDHFEYLHGLVAAGVILDDEESTTIGGLPATIVTVTSANDLEGALGCVGLDVSNDCLGFLTDLRLRMAVLKVGGKTQLIWGRSDRDSPETDNDKSLETMLASVEFRDAAISSSEPTS